VMAHLTVVKICTMLKQIQSRRVGVESELHVAGGIEASL